MNCAAAAGAWRTARARTRIHDVGTARAARFCGARLTGRYCADCSQAADVHVPSTLELVHQAIEGVTHSDSRLWRTLYLLWFKPGKLTQEFGAERPKVPAGIGI
jgi:Protein of unknown function (DUF3667)